MDAGRSKFTSSLLFVAGIMAVLLAAPAVAGAVTFAPQTDYAIKKTPRAVTLGDFNGDGLLDIATVGNNGVDDFSYVSILLNTPATPGTFGAAANVSIGATVGATAIVTTDCNNDGDLDLAVNVPRPLLDRICTV